MIDVEGLHRCPDRGWRQSWLDCVRCKNYPCPAIGKEVQEALAASPFTAPGPNSKLIARSCKMFLFLQKDDHITVAYAGFDPDKPDWGKLQDVEEVLQVSKVYQKQMKLVLKSKEERDAVRKAKKSGGKA